MIIRNAQLKTHASESWEYCNKKTYTSTVKRKRANIKTVNQAVNQPIRV